MRSWMMSASAEAWATVATGRPSASAGPGPAPLVQPHGHRDAAVLEVLRLRVALAAVADHGHAFPAEDIEIGVLLVVHSGGHSGPPLAGRPDAAPACLDEPRWARERDARRRPAHVGWVPRTSVTCPVRTISRI